MQLVEFGRGDDGWRGLREGGTNIGGDCGRGCGTADPEPSIARAASSRNRGSFTRERGETDASLRENVPAFGPVPTRADVEPS